MVWHAWLEFTPYKFDINEMHELNSYYAKFDIHGLNSGKSYHA